MSHILSAVLLLASCSIGASASALRHSDGVSLVGGSTKLFTRQTGPIILLPRDFNITVIDTSGHHDGIQSRELNQANSAPSKHKREVSRAIDTCPPQDPYFIRSTCDHTGGSLNLKAYKLTCNYRPTASLSYRVINDAITPGSCGPTEFCFQNDHHQGSSVAYCVSQLNMINLITAGSSPSGARQASLDTTGPAHNLLGQTVEVVFATPDSHAAIKMDSISVTAMAADKINGQVSYRAQVGGTNSCQGCSSIELPVVPEPTAQLRWNFSFHGLVGGASMFIVHWATT